MHYMYRGTSAAAAHVAGAVALLLQQTPHMSPNAVRLALRAQAIKDNFTGTGLQIPNAKWGYGKLHLGSSAPTAVGDLPGQISSFEASPNPTHGAISFDFVLSSDDVAAMAGRAPRILVVDLSGRRVAMLEGQAVVGHHRLMWNGLASDGRPAAPGVYLGRLEVGSRRAVRRFVRVL
jgi:hypothetical protein